MSKLQLEPMTIEVDGIKYPEWIEGVKGFWDFNRVTDSKNLKTMQPIL
ncbi:hypothetical protein [Shewanella sp. UCD-KL12]|nr:hypothetical protein [Shewanella sp. UCD-KL12]